MDKIEACEMWFLRRMDKINPKQKKKGKKIGLHLLNYNQATLTSDNNIRRLKELHVKQQ